MTLRIRQAQMQAFVRERRRSFEDRVLEHLRDRFPERCRQMTERELRELIQYGIDAADRYAIRIEHDVSVYIEQMLRFGRDLDRLPWAAKVLSDETEPDPTLRVYALREAGRKREPESQRTEPATILHGT